MDPTPAVEAPDGVRLAPPFHRLGPLLGHVVLGEALQCANELAVDNPRRERIEVAGDDGDPGFVEQRQTRFDVAVQDEQPGFATRPSAHAARSHLEPRSTARRAHCRAPEGSPVSIRS